MIWWTLLKATGIVQYSSVSTKMIKRKNDRVYIPAIYVRFLCLVEYPFIRLSFLSGFEQGELKFTTSAYLLIQRYRSMQSR